MKRAGHSNWEVKQQQALGKRINEIIIKAGYTSPSDFWTRRAGDYIARNSLYEIISGNADPKFTTLIMLARLLKKDIKEFF